MFGSTTFPGGLVHSNPIRPLLVSLSLATALASAGAPVPAQPAQEPGAVPTFGTTTELVYVRFHVEKKGHYLDHLTKDQIRVLEDGHPQTIALLETPSTRDRTVPPEVTLALDVSSSVMDERLLDESLVKDVLFANLSEQAKVGLCAFGGELRCLQPPTHDAAALLKGFREAITFGHQTRNQGTRLYDSVVDMCRGETDGETLRGETSHRARALIVFSDGLDTQGGRLKDAVQAAVDADVRVYPVLLSQAFQATARGVGALPFDRNRAMYDYKKFDLVRLADGTGGRSYEPATLDAKELAKIIRSIAGEISMENVVGFVPPGAPTGQKHHVKVELVDKSLGTIHDGERVLVR
jgi:VWFA-related protein